MRQIFFIIISVVFIIGCGKSKAPIKTQKQNEVDSIEILRPSWLIYGLPDEKERQRSIVDDWYGFRIRRVGGCMISDSLRDVVEQRNSITDSVLKIRIGPDWMIRFEKTVDSLYSIDSIAIAIARSDAYVRNFEINTEKHNDEYNYYPNLEYNVYFTPKENEKVVGLEGYGVIYKKVRRLSYLRITVDISQKKILNIEKTAYGY